MKPGSREFKTFDEFWPFYLNEHRHPTNRRLHFVGTALAAVIVVLAVVLRKPTLFLWAPVSGYAFAWAGHFLVERNRPATFTYPFWSLRGDFKMFVLMLTGRQ